jgi:hypothetical protein
MCLLSERTLRVFFLVAAVAAITLGVYARLDAFGSRQLAVDEYYFITSVRAILQRLLPELPGGGYYVRGLLVQYITAGCILVFGDNGVAYRLPSVIFSMGTVALMYWYSHNRLGKVLSATLCALLMVSSWEVEFARFARMYSALQFVTVAFFVALDVRRENAAGWRQYLPHLLVVCAVLTHELGVLLVPFLFAPVMGAIYKRDRLQLRALACYALLAVAVAVGCLAWQTASLRTAGVVDPFPRDFVPFGVPTLRTSTFPFWSVGSDPAVSLRAFLTVLGTAASVLLAIRIRWPQVKMCHVVAACLVIAALGHNFVLVIAFGGILVFRYGAPSRDCGLIVNSAVLVAFLASGSWLFWAATSPTWQDALGPEVGSLLGAIRVTFFGWPDFWTPLMRPWIQELPLLAVVGVGALGFQLVHNAKAKADGMAAHPAVVLIVIACAMGMLNSPYATTRYHFFVYPFILCTMILTVKELVEAGARRARERFRLRVEPAVALICVAGFALSRDFDIHHLVTAGSEEVSLRTGVFEPYAPTWYSRWDFASAASYVDRNIRSTEREEVVVVGLGVVQHYLNTDCALYLDRTDPRFTLVSRVSGTVDLWSGERLLSTTRELQDFTSAADRVWIVRAVGDSLVEVDRVWGTRVSATWVAHTSSDKRIEVLGVNLLDDFE